MKSNVIDGSVVNGLGQPIFFSFVLDKPAGYEVFSEPEAIQYKKINKSVLNTITFHLENDNNEEVDFSGEKLTFTSQLFKNKYIKGVLKKYKSDSYCVGCRHRSATTKIYGDTTSKSSNVLIGYCSKCNRKKSMTVSDNTIEAEGPSDFFKNLGKNGLSVSRKMAKNVLSKSGRALDLTARKATAAPSENSKQVLSTLPELIIFYNTGKCLYLSKFV